MIFAVRTRRVPFLRSRPSLPRTIAALATVALGVAIPFSPLAGKLGFVALPVPFLFSLLAMVACYLLLVELGKRRFYAPHAPTPAAGPPLRRHHANRLHRRTARFS